MMSDIDYLKHLNNQCKADLVGYLMNIKRKNGITVSGNFKLTLKKKDK